MCDLILDKMNDLSLLPFDNVFMYWSRCLVGETVSTEILISHWNLSILKWKLSSCYTCLNGKVSNLDRTSTFTPTELVPLSLKSLYRMIHTNILWPWMVATLYAWGHHRIFEKCFIWHIQKHVVTKGSVSILITRVVRVITVWYKVLLN